MGHFRSFYDFLDRFSWFLTLVSSGVFYICLYLPPFNSFGFFIIASFCCIINAGKYICKTMIGAVLFPSFTALMNLAFISSENFQLVNFTTIAKVFPYLFSFVLLNLFDDTIIINAWELFPYFLYRKHFYLFPSFPSLFLRNISDLLVILF